MWTGLDTTAELRYSPELYSSFVTQGLAKSSSLEVFISCISLVRQGLVTEVLWSIKRFLHLCVACAMQTARPSAPDREMFPTLKNDDFEFSIFFSVAIHGGIK